MSIIKATIVFAFIATLCRIYCVALNTLQHSATIFMDEPAIELGRILFCPYAIHFGFRDRELFCGSSCYDSSLVTTDNGGKMKFVLQYSRYPSNLAAVSLSEYGVQDHRYCICEARGSNNNYSKKRKSSRNARHSNSMGGLYYLSHIRSCAAITRSRCSVGGSSEVNASTANFVHKVPYMGLGNERFPQWMQHLSMSKDFVSGGGGPSEIKSPENIRNAYFLFKRRSNREFVPTTPNGHCGIYALQQFQHFFDGIPIYSRSNDVFNGRIQMAQALRRYRADLCILLGAYPDMTADQSIALLGDMIDERAAVHDSVKNDVEHYDSFAHVEGPLDFVAWSMEVKRNVCVVKYGEMNVMIYSENSNHNISRGIGFCVISSCIEYRFDFD